MPSEQQLALGEAITKARIALNITQETLARRAGTTKALIRALESGSQSMTVDLLTTLADVLNTTVGTLLGEHQHRHLPDACSHGRAYSWPDTFYLGIHDISWPMVAFGTGHHAYDWLLEDTVHRHVYQVSVTVLGEMREIPPTDPPFIITPIGGER